MAPRQQLSTRLHEIMGSDNNVYFQPPANITMVYPCIVYERNYIKNQFADNSPYIHTKRYQVTVIDRDPDSEYPDLVAALPMTTFARHFTADDLHHDVYTVYN